jgi:hypothetical protein
MGQNGDSKNVCLNHEWFRPVLIIFLLASLGTSSAKYISSIQKNVLVHFNYFSTKIFDMCKNKLSSTHRAVEHPNTDFIFEPY